MLLDTLKASRHARAWLPVQIETVRAQINTNIDLLLSAVERDIRKINDNTTSGRVSFGSFADTVIDAKKALNDEINDVMARAEKIAAGDL